ncbi:MAG: NAD(P)/FAD-dependent oxidoreductase [Epsilonproteobacteria bacterium]|nr:MAG: NAD(P)/FAD-dependent oxidoreductase [Campylobacterota bacterium]RLA67038.1 MAG: NAD(P)/FAD-dependent oxidoreductase [Campylobacterota bacterium]
MENGIYPVAIIGGGSAGTMAALRTILNNRTCIFFPGTGRDKKRSRAFWVAKVENVPGHTRYKKGIEEPNKETLQWMAESKFKDKFIWKQNRGIRKIKHLEDGLFELTDDKDQTYKAQYIILSTGLMDVQPHIQGDIKLILPFANMQTIDYCLRCDGHHTFEKHTSVIGHNSGAAWVAIMLHERYGNPSMKIFTNGEKPQFDDTLLKLIDLYNIEVHEEEIVDVLGKPEEGSLEGFILKGGKHVETEFSFVSLGMMVYNELATGLGAEVDDRGFVLTDSSGETSVKGLYVAGDLRAGGKKQIYTAWDQAVDTVDNIDGIIRRHDRENLLKKT